MNRYQRSHLGDASLLAQMGINASHHRQSHADLIADIGEVDERRLYLPAPYPSMYAFLVGEYHMSEDVACKRITVAKKAREFPVIFEAIADGRLHLSGVVMLAPHLKQENREAAEALLAAAAYKSKSEILKLLKRHLNGPEQPVPPAPPASSCSPFAAESIPSAEISEAHQLSSAEPPFELSAPGRIDVRASAHRNGQLDLDEETEQMLEYARSLLGHQVPPGDLARLLRKLLELSIPQLEKQKLGANSPPRRGGTCSKDPRHIPVHVKCTVWKRDGGQCTFVSESGQRCSARTPLEFDHIVEVARGGAPSVENIRLRCRGHNQYTAGQTFGTGFMQRKREEARQRTAEKRTENAVAVGAEMERSENMDVMPWLRALGYPADRIRRAVAQCGAMPEEATLEERVKAALRYLMPPHRHVKPVAA